ncbi:MAG: hypothetical protein KAR16_05935 [Bacteroidales bacterium]|nr:hypothetical protein [Bacteroidales bacterium]
MKKILFLLMIILVSLPSMSQGKKYQKGMLKAIELMNDAADPESSLQCVTTFEEFAQKYPDQWIPFYYASQILIIASLEESDPAKSDTLLVRAKKSLDKASELAPEESEIHVLKALYYIGMMSVDPATRGPEYFQDVTWELDRAKELGPENPRAAFLDGMMAMNLPDYMGGGPAAAKPIFLDAEKKFNEFQNNDPLWPSWGTDQVKEELEKLKDIEIEEKE